MARYTRVTEKEIELLRELCVSAVAGASQQSVREVHRLIGRLREFNEVPAAEPTATIRNKLKVVVDRETPLDVQLVALVKGREIGDQWFRELTSALYPSDMTRPTELLLGECNVGHIGDDESPRSVIEMVNGVTRNGDPYEFAAWLRATPKAGLEYPIAALDQFSQNSADYIRAPHASSSGDRLHISSHEVNRVWIDRWFFLVVCEEEKSAA